MALIISLLGNTIIRYVVMTLIGSAVGLGALAWIRSSARAPYEAQVTELKHIIVKRDQAQAADRKLAEEEAARAERLKDELDKITVGGAACKLSAAELKRLQQLSRSN